MALQTFKLTDQLSGETLGVRPDITPQAARIDARHGGEGVNRLCYYGTVLRTHPDGLGGSRCPRQLGAELFGEPSLHADVEIIQLMLATLTGVASITDVHLDVGHVGIYRAVIKDIDLSDAAEAELFAIIQRKSKPDLQAWLSKASLPAQDVARIQWLVGAHGALTVLDEGEKILAGNADGLAALKVLKDVVARLQQTDPSIPVHVDLAELRGFRYHTGLVFAAFVPGHRRELARGGRYDGVGKVFGAERPATGFSVNLNEMVQYCEPSTAPDSQVIAAPHAPDEAELQTLVMALREQGRSVLTVWDGDLSAYSARIENVNGNWKLVEA